MPRKFFKKYLPSHESIQQNRFINFFGKSLHHHNLWHLHRRSVAGGFAAGLFAGLIPGSNPVQFFFAALFSIIFKVNLPVAALTTLYSNPFTILPLYWTAYLLGSFFIDNGMHNLPPLELNLSDKAFSEWAPAAIAWLTSFGKPLIIGLTLLASFLAITGYILVRLIWRFYIIHTWRKRHQSTQP